MVRPVTAQKAYDLFNLVNATTCFPLNPSFSCIPFLYPDDGCFARAHEMCRLIIAQDVDLEKIWAYGDLCVTTKNHPSCKVRWHYHVAPILHVQIETAYEIWVIDPSLFQAPVNQAIWVGVLGDPGAIVDTSDISVYYKNINRTLVTYDDVLYTETRSALDDFRDNLRLRSAIDGPPPYPCI